MPLKIEHPRTTPGYSITCEGHIPHRRITIGDGAKLDLLPVVVPAKGAWPRPLRTHRGWIVYALLGRGVLALEPQPA